MSYSQASTNSSDASSDTIAFIEAGLTAHAGWSFVEQTTAYSGWIGRVWKCLGTQNAHGLDFHLILSRPTGASGLISVRLSEGYDVTTHSVIRPAPYPNAATPVSATDGSIGNGALYALNTTVTPAVTGAQFGNPTNAPGTLQLTVSIATDHFLVVSKSFVAYSVNQSGVAVGGFYVGSFDPVYSPTFNPVMAVMVGTNPMLSSSVTRFPNCTATPNFATGDAFLLPATFPDGYLTTLSVAELFRSKMEASSVLVAGAAAIGGMTSLYAPVGLSGPTLSATPGGLRGTLPSSVMLMVSEAVPPRNGDFFQVGSSNYFRVGIPAAAPYGLLVAQPNRVFYVAQDATY